MRRSGVIVALSALPGTAAGMVTAVSEKGRTGPVLAPADVARFGLPPLAETAGLLTAPIDANGNVTSLPLPGHVLLDTCAALS